MSAIKGDFIGFTYGGVHSSELGIMRVSNGSRYSETLLPEFSNKTVNVPGANRVDYLGMESTQKSFPLDIAFDSVTEEQLREMRRLFGTNKPLPLVFDESPYKTYYAKAGGNPSFTYICFDEDGKRIYKGEGKIDLVTFYPYAFCEPNYVYNHTNNPPENLYEWLNTSGLSEDYTKLGGTGLTKTETDPKGNNYTVYTFEIYNSGDFDCPFKCLFEFSKLPKGGLELVVEDKVINSIYWSESPNETNPTIGNGNYGILINGYNQLIEKVFIEKEEGTKKIKKLDKIYNGYINSGNWFNIPKGNEIKIRFITYQSGVNASLDYKILYI